MVWTRPKNSSSLIPARLRYAQTHETHEILPNTRCINPFWELMVFTLKEKTEPMKLLLLVIEEGDWMNYIWPQIKSSCPLESYPPFDAQLLQSHQLMSVCNYPQPTKLEPTTSVNMGLLIETSWPIKKKNPIVNENKEEDEVSQP